MKTYSGELFELIESLSLSEKRYCALYLQKHSAEDNRYLKLFNVLKQQATYNSKQASSLVGYANTPAHYSVLKKQLYEQLLDALHQYDMFSNPEQQLMRGIHQCTLLLQKGLFAQCEKRIKALAKVADEMEHTEAQLQLQNLRMVMKARKYYRQVSEQELSDWQQHTLSIVNSYETSSRYKYLSSLVFKMQYDAGARGKDLAARMKDIIQLPEFSNEKKAVTLRARLDLLQVRALYHFTNQETEKAAVYNERFLTLLDERPMMRQLHADRYFSVLNNYLIDCLVLAKNELLEEGLAKLRSLTKIPAFKKLANFEANVFRLGFLLEMNYRVTAGRFADAYLKIKEITKGFAEFGDKIVKHNRITLQYLMAYVCFALGKYDEALDHLWPVLQEKENQVAEDVQLVSRIMQLLCHFEKGDKMLLDSQIKSLQRSLLKKDARGDIERAVISFIRSSLRLQLSGKAKWSELDKKISKLAIDKVAASSLNLFNYNVWVKAHVNNISFERAWNTG